MVDKINFEALEQIDMETAAAFVEGVGTVASIISVAEASEQELRASLNVIAQSLAVAGAILYAGACGGDPLIKPLGGQETFRKEIA